MFDITHRGVPIGRFQVLPPGELVTVGVQPADAYWRVRDVVRAASEALADFALQRGASGPQVADALRRGAELGRELELREATGGLVPTDFIELADWPGGDPPLAATIQLRESHASVGARLEQRRAGGGESSVPAA